MPEEPFVASITKVAAQRFLYSPIRRDGERSFEIDERLTDLESTIAPVWSALATDAVDLTRLSVRRIIALFVATLGLRHPATLSKRRDIHRRLNEFFEAGPKDVTVAL